MCGVFFTFAIKLHLQIEKKELRIKLVFKKMP
jgi:hypothetical protein